MNRYILRINKWQAIKTPDCIEKKDISYGEIKKQIPFYDKAISPSKRRAIYADADMGGAVRKRQPGINTFLQK